MQYISVKKVALRYDCSVSTVWRWVKEGILPHPRELAPNTTRWEVRVLDEHDKKHGTPSDSPKLSKPPMQEPSSTLHLHRTLSAKTVAGLEAKGLTDIAPLAKMSDIDILRIPGLAKGSLREIRQTIEKTVSALKSRCADLGQTDSVGIEVVKVLSERVTALETESAKQKIQLSQLTNFVKQTRELSVDNPSLSYSDALRTLSDAFASDLTPIGTLKRLALAAGFRFEYRLTSVDASDSQT